MIKMEQTAFNPMQTLSGAAWVKKPRQIPETWRRLFAFIGDTGKSYAELVDFLAREKLQITEGGMRAGLMNYRKEFGLIESPRKGFYVATSAALDLIAQRKEESLVTANDEAPVTQPIPLTGTAAVGE